MPKRRVRVLSKKQKVTETTTTSSPSLEQAVREPTFVRGRPRRMPSLPLALPFGSPEQAQAPQGKSDLERTQTEQPENTNRETFSYERPGAGAGGNSTTYRIAGATNQTDNQVYHATGETRVEEERRERAKSTTQGANNIRSGPELTTQTAQERYAGATQKYDSSGQPDKKKIRELERSRF